MGPGLALAAAALVAAQDPPPPDRARGVSLIVMVSVDQMVPWQLERLAPWLDGGLGRFAREGRSFSDAALRHGDTETGPGHASYGTGLHPTRHGIVSNDWFAVEGRSGTYCCADPEARKVSFAGVHDERASSARNLRARGIADFLEAADPRARTLAISSKDRSAIGMSGVRADLCLWWDRRRGGFVTSTWYARELPGWAAACSVDWIERLRAAGFADSWRCELPEDFEGSGTSLDECEGEWGRPGQRAFPHPVPAAGEGAERAALAGWVYDGPAGDVLVLDLARRAVEALELGRDDAVDLLAVSLSSCDTVGHAYGPRSVEVTDVLLRADRELERLFDLLDERVGRERWIASLSADHGVLELPEALAARGLPARRISGRTVRDSIDAARAQVAERFGRDFYLASNSRGIRLSWAAMKEAGADAGEVRRAYAAAMGLHGGEWLEHALTFDELRAVAREGAPAPELVRLEANSFDQERTCDVVLLCKRWCLVGVAAGTTHGTPYPYDRAVPLAFYGPGFAKGTSREPAASVDALPTLLARAGLPIPPGLDGRDLLAPK
jgi:hypothetical protein